MPSLSQRTRLGTVTASLSGSGAQNRLYWTGTPAPDSVSATQVYSYSFASLFGGSLAASATITSVGTALPTGWSINSSARTLDYAGTGSGGTTAGVILRASASGDTADCTAFSLVVNSASGSTLTTLTLVNTSSSAQATNFLTPCFGHAFKKGDIPSGTYPQFEVSGGSACPHTMLYARTWSDGSLKFAGFILRVPSSIAGSGTLTINVKNGGAAQAASALGTSSLTAQDLKVELVGVTNLTGTWTSSLNQGVTDNDDVAVIGDGAAGKFWRIRQQFMSGGSNHGQLECWHYVCALQDSSGSLAGIRYLGRVAQPWYNIDSPAKNDRTFTATFKNGSTTLRSLNGGSNITLPHFCSFFTAGSDGKYDYIAGSITTDSTVRVKVNRTYQNSTRVIPPYDLTVTATPQTADTYTPMQRGSYIEAFWDNTGYHNGIGHFPEWAARYFCGQDAADEQTVRTTGLYQGSLCLALYNATTKTIPVVNNTTYSGMPSPDISFRWRGVTGAPGNSGFTEPSGNTMHIFGAAGQTGWNTSHWVSLPGPAYIVFGEPQFLDMMLETGNNAVYNRYAATAAPASGGSRNTIVGSTTYYGNVLTDPDMARTDGWALKELGLAAGLCPDSHVAKQYMMDMVASSFDVIVAYNAAQGAFWNDNGWYHFRQADGIGQDWMLHYLLMGACVAYQLTEDPDGLTFINHLVKWWTARGGSAGLSTYMMTGYNFRARATESGSSALISSMSDFFMMVNCTGVASTDTFTISTGGTLGPGNLRIQNGDEVMFFFTPPSGFSAYTRYYMVNVNAVSGTFQLAATAGGAVINLTADYAGGDTRSAMRNFATQTAWGMEIAGTGGYTASAYAAIRHAAALGATNASARAAEMDAIYAVALTSGGSTPAQNPKNSLASSF